MRPYSRPYARCKPDCADSGPSPYGCLDAPPVRPLAHAYPGQARRCTRMNPSHPLTPAPAASPASLRGGRVTNPVEKLARTWSAAETCGRAPLPPLRRAAFPPRLVLAARQERAAGAPTFPQPLAEPQSPSAQTLAPDSPPRRATPRPDIPPVTAWIDFQTEEGSGYCLRRQAEKWIEETLGGMEGNP